MSWKSHILLFPPALVVGHLALFHSNPAAAHGPKTPPAAEIIVHTEKPGNAIAPDFLGFSYEASALTKDTFSTTHTEFLRLLANLGTGTLRFGGNSVEFTYWSRDGAVNDPGRVAPSTRKTSTGF